MELTAKRYTFDPTFLLNASTFADFRQIREVGNQMNLSVSLPSRIPEAESADELYLMVSEYGSLWREDLWPRSEVCRNFLAEDGFTTIMSELSGIELWEDSPRDPIELALLRHSLRTHTAIITYQWPTLRDRLLSLPETLFFLEFPVIDNLLLRSVPASVQDTEAGPPIRKRDRLKGWLKENITRKNVGRFVLKRGIAKAASFIPGAGAVIEQVKDTGVELMEEVIDKTGVIGGKDA